MHSPKNAISERKEAKTVVHQSLLVAGLSARVSLCVEAEGDDPLDWLRNSIPGEPGLDYPILAAVQDSAFTCDGLTFGGYYADVEQQCQVSSRASNRTGLSLKNLLRHYAKWVTEHSGQNWNKYSQS